MHQDLLDIANENRDENQTKTFNNSTIDQNSDDE